MSYCKCVSDFHLVQQFARTQYSVKYSILKLSFLNGVVALNSISEILFHSKL